MQVDVHMPKMGESITEGRILKWLKNTGDRIDRDETLLEIATDKVDTEVPAPAAGVVAEILAAEGDTVEVGTVIARIETADGPETARVPSVNVASAAGPDTPAAKVEPPPTMKPAGARAALDRKTPPIAGEGEAAENASTTVGDGGNRFYSPVVMRIASERGIGLAELSSVPGTGGGNRVTKSDLLAYLERKGETAAQSMSAAPPVAPTSADGEVEVIPMDNMHRLMAEHMVRSKQVSPHVALVSEVDMTPIIRFRDSFADAFKAREGIPLTLLPFIADAAVRALAEFPYVNSSVDGTNILLKRFINLGIAVALKDGGLIVPVIKRADTLNMVGLARAISDVATRARARQLQPDEIQNGTFTITNFGVFGNVFGIPIINQPQVAILGVGAVRKKPVVVERNGEDAIAIRSLVQLSLAFDHRIVDGALGGKFLQRIAFHLEQFNLQSL